MKKLLVVILLALFLSGCGTIGVNSEFWKHDTMYKNCDHMKFSWSGFKNPTSEHYRQAKEQGWWGIDIPYTPAQ